MDISKFNRGTEVVVWEVKMITDWIINKAEGFQYRYVIHKKKGLITCIMKPCFSKDTTLTNNDDFLDYYLNKHFNSHGDNNISIQIDSKNNIISPIYGVTKCNLEKDKFDEKRGKEIAYRRTYEKFMLKREKNIEKIKNKMEYIYDELFLATDKLRNKKKDNLDKLRNRILFENSYLDINIVDFLYKMNVCTKKSEIHDLLEKNEIKINGETYNNPKYHIKIKDFINNIIGIEKRQERYYFHINNLKEKGIV